MRKNKVMKGFTLIELLIVVAIIAILAAIAVPNFIEAQIRAKVSRIKADLRTYATACEAYNIDNNSYPVWLYNGVPGQWSYNAQYALIPLSTPVAYLANAALIDPFESAYKVTGMLEPNGTPANGYIWSYDKWTGASGKASPASTFGDYWSIDSLQWNGCGEYCPNLNLACINSDGPGSDLTNGCWWVPEWAPAIYFDNAINHGDPNPGLAVTQFYDPSNGTVSPGGIARYVGETQGFSAPN